MIISGLQKTTLVDYPGKVAATVFTRGCSFRCPFCHNPELVIPERFLPAMPPSDFWQFLDKRRGKLEAVCITGGEPMMHDDIIDFMKKIKEYDYLVKLDTNGSFPDRLDQTIKEKAVDYIAMDIKGPIDRYAEISRYPGPSRFPSVIPAPDQVEGKTPAGILQEDPRVKPEDDKKKMMTLEDKIEESIKLIMNSGIPYEFRTTFFKPLLSVEDIPKMGEMIKGAERYYIQNFVYSKHNDEGLEMSPFSDAEIAEAKRIMSVFVKEVGVR